MPTFNFENKIFHKWHGLVIWRTLVWSMAVLQLRIDTRQVVETSVFVHRTLCLSAEAGLAKSNVSLQLALCLINWRLALENGRFG